MGCGCGGSSPAQADPVVIPHPVEQAAGTAAPAPPHPGQRTVQGRVWTGGETKRTVAD